MEKGKTDLTAKLLKLTLEIVYLLTEEVRRILGGHMTSLLSLLIKHRPDRRGDRPFECVECERKCSLRSTLVCHYKVHIGERHAGSSDGRTDSMVLPKAELRHWKFLVCSEC
ncbi:hypothetical protein AB205_0156790, partial [Aquarana catesbeiana]